jgi:hypothetical protein
MSQENVELVRSWLDAWVEWFNLQRDPDALAEITSRYMAPTVTYEEDPPTVCGHRASREMLAKGKCRGVPVPPRMRQ